jgi:regulator of protease activity HflC (stomatin/prohibitin superfamily)
MSALVFGTAIAALAVVIVGMGVKVVPQGYAYTIEKFGRYTHTLSPGLNFLIPFVETVGKKVSLMETVMNIPPQECISSDNVMVKIDAVCFYQVIDPSKSAYEIGNLEVGIKNLVMTNIRTALGSLELDALLSNREAISGRLMQVVAPAVENWGVRMLRVEIADVTPPAELIDAMASQMKAERLKRASVLEAEGRRQAEILTAEGEKQAQILKAEGEREAAFMQAEARVRSAQAEAKATQAVSDAIASGNMNAINYFVANRYIDALSAIGHGESSKVVFMPLDAASVMGSVGGITELLAAAKKA